MSENARIMRKRNVTNQYIFTAFFILLVLSGFYKRKENFETRTILPFNLSYIICFQKNLKTKPNLYFILPATMFKSVESEWYAHKSI